MRPDIEKTRAYLSQRQSGQKGNFRIFHPANCYDPIYLSLWAGITGVIEMPRSSVI